MDDLAFTTQRSNEDGSQPDLVGCAVDGSEPVAIELKFWAGLTIWYCRQRRHRGSGRSTTQPGGGVPYYFHRKESPLRMNSSLP
jgi:hypothetical protein